MFIPSIQPIFEKPLSSASTSSPDLVRAQIQQAIQAEQQSAGTIFNSNNQNKRADKSPKAESLKQVSGVGVSNWGF